MKLNTKHDVFKTGSDVEKFIQKNPCFIECLKMALTPQIPLVGTFCKMYKLKEEDLKFDKSFEKIADEKDRVALNFFGFVHNNLFLSLSKQQKTMIEDSLKIENHCLALGKDGKEKYDFGIVFRFIGGVYVSVVGANKGDNLNEIFNEFNKLLGKKLNYEVSKILLFNEPTGDDSYKTVSGDEIKDPQKFMDEYQQP